MKRIPEKIGRLFWDVDREKVDLNRHRSYIIRRVMDHGEGEDVRWMLTAYSPEEIKDVLKKNRGLSRKSACFWATYFNIPKEEVACLQKSCMKRLRPY